VGEDDDLQREHQLDRAEPPNCQQIVDDAGAAEHRQKADRDHYRGHNKGQDRHRPEERPARKLEACQQVGPRQANGDADDRRQQRLIGSKAEQAERYAGHPGVDPCGDPSRETRRIAHQRVCRTGIKRIAEDGNEWVDGESPTDVDGTTEDATDGIVKHRDQRCEHGSDPDREQSGRLGPHGQLLTIWRAQSSTQPLTLPTNSS